MKTLGRMLIVAALCVFTLVAKGQDEETVSLFTISELSGTVTYFAENGKLLPQPKSVPDKIGSPSIVQAKTSKGSKSKFIIAHNTGSDEVVMMLVGQSMCFFSATDKMHSSLTICLDRRNQDGSFLVIETQVRPNFLESVTSARVFYGKATPTIRFASWLKEEGSK
ncbi:MAG: hypothetical protein NTV51_11795 [Verrucomicrobia bacterium]|nr:hypothetical protein [Verrucomicrobiota bacterium]